MATPRAVSPTGASDPAGPACQSTGPARLLSPVRPNMPEQVAGLQTRQFGSGMGFRVRAQAPFTSPRVGIPADKCVKTIREAKAT